MKRIKILFSLIAFVAIMMSCNKDEASSADGFATVSFRNIGIDSEVISTITPSRSGEEGQTDDEVSDGNEDGQENTDGGESGENGGTETEEPFDPIAEAVKNGFKLSVVTNLSVEEYDETVYACTDYEKFNNGECENVELRVGNYTVFADLGNPEVEGFEQPYYSGSKDIHLDKGENVDVDLECKLANSILKINYTENFKKYFSTYSSYVSTSKGNTVEYVQDETRGAYMASGEVTVYVKAKKMGANEAALNVGKYTLNPQYEYALTLDVDASNAIMKVTFSENWKDESVIINVSDAALNANAPYMVGEGVESGVEFTIVEGVALNETLKVSINAEAEIASCLMTTTSDYLKGKGWAESVDLASADESTMSAIKASGVDLKGFSGSLSQMAYLDFTELVRALPKESPVDVRLKVTDKFGKVSEEFVFLAETQNCMFSVSSAGEEAPFLGNECKVNVTLLEGDVNNVQFALADGGQPLSIQEISEPVNVDGVNQYTMTLGRSDGQSFKETFNVSAEYLTYSSKIEIPVYFGLEIDNIENDVWAKRATVHLYNETAENIFIQKKESDGNWVDVERILNEDGRITAYDLSPDTKIALRAVKKSDNSKATNEIGLKTWKVVSLPNGDMEDWMVGPDGMEGHGDVTDYIVGVKYDHIPYRSWERWYPYSSSSEPHWDTVNMLTTSLGEEKSGFLGAGDNKRWTRYVANSGTIKTTGKEGNGALVKTVGWGDGNTAGGEISVINNITPGELYLGTYSSNPIYGIPFNGLPDGLRFDYKYVTKNADRYVLNIQMYSGNTLMVDQTLSSEEALPVNEWTEKYIPFVYLNKQNEPTTLSIVFKSGTSTSKDDIRVFAPFRNLTTGENIGSELYLDNIELIYE